MLFIIKVCILYLLVILSLQSSHSKIIRISESCGYTFNTGIDQKYFNTSIFCSYIIDRFMGDILKNVSGVMYVFMGWPGP